MWNPLCPVVKTLGRITGREAGTCSPAAKFRPFPVGSPNRHRDRVSPGPGAAGTEGDSSGSVSGPALPCARASPGQCPARPGHEPRRGHGEPPAGLGRVRRRPRGAPPWRRPGAPGPRDRAPGGRTAPPRHGAGGPRALPPPRGRRHVGRDPRHHDRAAPLPQGDHLARRTPRDAAASVQLPDAPAARRELRPRLSARGRHRHDLPPHARTCSECIRGCGAGPLRSPNSAPTTSWDGPVPIHSKRRMRSPSGSGATRTWAWCSRRGRGSSRTAATNCHS